MRLAVAVMMVAVTGAQAVTHFNDGETWNIGYQINTSVHVDEGPTHAETKTTVNFIQGGSIAKGWWPHNELKLYNQSTVGIDGGEVFRIHSYDSSTVNISSGIVEERVICYDSSTVTFTGGTVSGVEIWDSSTATIMDGDIEFLFAWNDNIVNIHGGSLGSISARRDSTINISDGSIGQISVFIPRGDNRRIDITGGTVGEVRTFVVLTGSEHFRLSDDLTLADLESYGVTAAEGTVHDFEFFSINALHNSTAVITGGSMTNLTGDGNSRVYISGGNIERVISRFRSTVGIAGGDIGEIRANEDSTFMLYGQNFNLSTGLTWGPGGEIIGTGRILGTWFDGTIFNIQVAANATTSTLLAINEQPPLAVDFEDLAAFSSQWLNTNCQPPTWCGGADLDKSGTVDIIDLLIFVENWLVGFYL